MGSFDVACSISNLTIHPGDKALFLPLLPNIGYRGTGKHVIEKGSMLIYPNCLFNPFSLHIEGVYDDYGRISKIKRDATVSSIEDYFGIDIEKFMGCVSCSREWSCYMSEINEAYGLKPVSKLLSDYGTKFDDKFMKTLGFTKQKTGEHVFKLPSLLEYSVIIKDRIAKTPDYMEAGFIIKNDKGDILFDCGESHREKDEFLRQFQEVTGYYLGIAPENHDRVTLLRRMSGMFILKEIYDGLSCDNKTEDRWKERASGMMADAHPTHEIIEAWGFKKDRESTTPGYKNSDKRNSTFFKKKGFEAQISCEGSHGFTAVLKMGKSKSSGYPDLKEVEYKSKEFDEGRYEHTFTVKELAKSWEKATGDKLDMVGHNQTYQRDVAYDNYRNQLIERDAVQAKLKKIKTKNKTEADLKLELLMMKLSFNGYGDPFKDYFKDWDYFDVIYTKPIKQGKLKEQFRWFVSFYHSMYSCNRFYFPAMNGEQHGNDEEMKNLLDVSVRIVNQRLKEYAAERVADNEDEEEHEEVSA